MITGQSGIKLKKDVDDKTLERAYELMCTARSMSDLFEEKSQITSKYVHACSRGHEAVQLALGLQLKPQDFLSAYYRDDSILLGLSLKPYELMLQLLAKRDDPFSGGRTYYCHPALRRDDMPKIPHQSSATGMQAIPTTGIAMGVQYLEKMRKSESEKVRKGESDSNSTSHNSLSHSPTFSMSEPPVVVCSLGDGSMTEGEVSEALQMAVLKKFPILYFVQDNDWDISASAKEVRAMDASEYAKGFKGLEVRSIDGTDFFTSYRTIHEVLDLIRKERRPFMIHAKVPLLAHHTSGVRREWYRDDLEEHAKRDPLPKFRKQLLLHGFEEKNLTLIETRAKLLVQTDFEKALKAEDPRPEDLFNYDFAPTPITEEKGEREPKNKDKTLMVDCALFAVQELMTKHKECLLYGQDVGGKLGGVFREAATLAQKFGDDRVFNTPIQEAFIIGSTVGMSAAGCKPIVEVQFADYIFPGLNQLFTEVSRSYYLSNGKWPVSCIIRVPIGAYGSGGPYHSTSIESILTNIRGIKIAYPSNGADLKGLIKAAYYDNNPCVILEHKGLYWSKIKGTEEAKTIEPSEDYILPFGKARIVPQQDGLSVGSPSPLERVGVRLSVITYGMGVYWAKAAAKNFPGQIEIIDLRTLVPLDEKTMYESVRKHGRCLIVTEEPVKNSFAQSLAGMISKECFETLDAPVHVIGSENLPAIPLNSTLEATMLPNADKVAKMMEKVLKY
jgi:2-oxoisovalerate dehydrogenase E1 component